RAGELGHELLAGELVGGRLRGHGRRRLRARLGRERIQGDRRDGAGEEGRRRGQVASLEPVDHEAELTPGLRSFGAGPHRRMAPSSIGHGKTRTPTAVFRSSIARRCLTRESRYWRTTSLYCRWASR